jgi:hypothetical protein
LSLVVAASSNQEASAMLRHSANRVAACHQIELVTMCCSVRFSYASRTSTAPWWSACAQETGYAVRCHQHWLWNTHCPDRHAAAKDAADGSILISQLSSSCCWRAPVPHGGAM